MPITIKDLKGPKGYPLVGNIPKLDLPNLHRQLENWSDEFGDVYRLNLGYTNQTIVTRPSIIQKICAARPEEFIRMEKMDNVLRGAGVRGVFNAEGEDWKLHRKIIARGLDVRHQKEFYPSMLVSIERLYNRWSEMAETGEAFDIQRDLLRFTVDITATLAFGVEMNTLEQEGSAIQDHMDKVFPMIFKRINSPIPWHKIIRSKKDKEFEAAVVEMTKLVDKFIVDGQEQLKNNPELRENPTTLLESILVAAEEEEDFSIDFVRGNLLTLLLAGEDTTAHTLVWLIYLLTIHTDQQEGMRKEADEVLKDEPWLTNYSAMNDLKFIEGAALESMRFKPVAPVLLFQATKDIEIEGYLFKKDAKIITQSRHGALKEENFTRAEDFDPSRWLKSSKCPVHNLESFVPFGSGPRYCPGKNLAILEIRMVMSMLFKNFNIEMVTPHEDIKEIMAFTMMASDYKVRLSKRS